MEYFVLLKALHIISAVIWLSVIPLTLTMKKLLEKPEVQKKNILPVFMKQTELLSRIGMIGILATGITLSIQLGYGFFKFASPGGHWLYTKQLLMLGIIYLIVVKLIPSSKKLNAMMKEQKEDQPPSEEMNLQLKKVASAGNGIVILVVISFLLAIFRLLM